MEKRIVIRSVALATALLSAHVLSAAIPARYQELTYIQSAGAQWINTGYVPAGTDTIVAKVRFNQAKTGTPLPSDNVAQCVWCASDAEGKNQFSAVRTTGKKLKFYRADGSVTTGSTVSPGYIIDMSANGATLSATVGGQVLTLPSGEYEPGSALTIFALHTAGTDLADDTTMAQFAHFQLYRLRIFSADGTLKKDFRPVKDTQAGAGSVAECGLYDIVDGVFCPNKGTTAFTAGAAATTSDDPSNDLTILSAGTRTLASPVSYATLANLATDGAVTFDQTDVLADAEHANSFTDFQAINRTTTVFDGGWWDFGAAAGSKDYNFLGNDYSSYRTILIDHGAVVTNVGGLLLAGYCLQDNGSQSSAMYNSLRVADGSSLTANRIILELANNGSSYSTLTVDGGSRLTVLEKFFFGISSPGSDSRYNSHNVFALSNENTVAVFKNDLNIGANSDASYGGNTPGGNTMLVADNAYVRAGVINIGGGTRCFDNHLVVTSSGRVDCTEIDLNSLQHGNKAKGWLSGDRLEILDGGIVTNTGTTVVGYPSSNNSGSGGMHIVISNGTFYTQKLRFAHAQCATNCSITLSGPAAVLVIGDTNDSSGYHPFGDAKSGGNNAWIFENGAKWRWPWIRWCYTGPCHDQSVIVRTGAELSFSSMALVTENNSCSKRNRLSLESGATATGVECYVGNEENRLSVSNATLSLSSSVDENRYAVATGSALTIGGPTTNAGPATNDTLEIWGDCPRIEALNGGAAIWNESYLDFHLPPNGYREGVIPISVGKTFRMAAGCRFSLFGVDGLCAYQKDVVGKTGKYMLIKAKSIVLPDDVMAEALAALPENCSLRIVDTDDGMKALVLKVRVPAGLLLLVR